MVAKPCSHLKAASCVGAAAVLCAAAVACGGSQSVPGAALATRASRPLEAGGGSDNDIPAYGHEASSSDKRAVTALVKRYYAAAARRDGAAACSMLLAPVARAIPGDYQLGALYERGRTCRIVLAKVFAHLHERPSEVAATEVTDVRLYRDRGFAELRSKKTPKGEIYVQREGGSWRVGVVLGRPRAGP